MKNRTGQIAVLGSLVTAAALCLGVAAAQAQPSLTVSNVANATPGSQVTISVTLSAGGAQVAGTQNTLTFDNTNATLNLNAKGKPDCTVNPDIDKGGTAFALQPAGCSGSTCTGVKALVLALDNTDAIVDGSVLYTCNVNVAATASGTSTVTISGLGMSDPNGANISGATGVNGTITIAGGPSPTTAEATPTPTIAQPTPRPTPSGPALIVDVVNATAGQQLVALGVTLFSGGAQVAGTQNTLTFDNTNVTLNLNAKGKPDCTVNPDIDKGGTAFALQPAGCSGSTCTGVKALVLALDNTDAIVDGSVLYTCNVNVAATASGTSIVTISGVGMSDPNGANISGATGENGAVIVAGPVGPTSTPTDTPTTAPIVATNTPTNTVIPPTTAAPPTNTPTKTPSPIPPTQPGGGLVLTQAIGAADTTLILNSTTGLGTSGQIMVENEIMNYTVVNATTLSVVRGVLGSQAVAHAAGTPVVKVVAVPQEDEGGCEIGAASAGVPGWLLLIPVAGLAALRRRQRR